ncbi:MAG: ABC transporter ATP-binding protein, partial [Spirochaetia bacterium]|nr:ABC transporter ATP-binding protein [Spirochaetia bacterium]
SDVLLLDESFSSVDLKLKIELMDLFSQLWEEEKRTTIFITHDIKEALYLADTIILLSSRPARILKNFVLDTPRSRRLFSATEYHAIEDEILKMILR